MAGQPTALAAGGLPTRPPVRAGLALLRPVARDGVAGCVVVRFPVGRAFYASPVLPDTLAAALDWIGASLELDPVCDEGTGVKRRAQAAAAALWAIVEGRRFR